MTLEQIYDYLDDINPEICKEMEDACNECPFGIWDYEGCAYSCTLQLFQNSLEEYEERNKK